ncbi:MAG: hypothetical protein M0Q92_08740 [Methanoregula sp.]|jgi:hypothetical protein|nr:hypothetical protein [Methanoregula sp.]
MNTLRNLEIDITNGKLTQELAERCSKRRMLITKIVDERTDLITRRKLSSLALSYGLVIDWAPSNPSNVSSTARIFIRPKY